MENIIFSPTNVFQMPYASDISCFVSFVAGRAKIFSLISAFKWKNREPFADKNLEVSPQGREIDKKMEKGVLNDPLDQTQSHAFYLDNSFQD